MPRTYGSRHYVMCRPTYFDVTYSINPWMDPAKPTSADIAIKQWELLHDLYEKLGAACMRASGPTEVLCVET